MCCPNMKNDSECVFIHCLNLAGAGSPPITSCLDLDLDLDHNKQHNISSTEAEKAFSSPLFGYTLLNRKNLEGG